MIGLFAGLQRLAFGLPDFSGSIFGQRGGGLHGKQRAEREQARGVLDWFHGVLSGAASAARA